MNKHKPCTTCSDISYSGVWLLMKIIVRHEKSHRNLKGKQVLTSVVEALECHAKGMPFIMYGVFCFATFANSYKHEIHVPRSDFHVGASPVIIARKTAKLFEIFPLANSM